MVKHVALGESFIVTEPFLIEHAVWGREAEVAVLLRPHSIHLARHAVHHGRSLGGLGPLGELEWHVLLRRHTTRLVQHAVLNRRSYKVHWSPPEETRFSFQSR